MTKREAEAEARRLNMLMGAIIWRAHRHEHGWGVWDGKSSMIINCKINFVPAQKPGEWTAEITPEPLPELRIF